MNFKNIIKNKNMNKKFGVFSTATILFSCIGFTAFADDIEIYTGNKGGEAESNVMILIDTSGSMGWDAGTGTGETRMELVKSSIENTLNLLPERLKVGLASYNLSGAAIIHPAERLDKISAAKVNDIIIEGANDVDENIDGEITFDETELYFNKTKNIKVEVEMTSTSQDAEQCENGFNYSRGGSYLDNVDNGCYSRGSSNLSGMVFRNVDIPQGAQIVSAFVELTHWNINNYSNDVVDVEIFIEDNALPSNYTSTRNIVGRVRHSENYDWDNVSAKQHLFVERTGNLANLVQHVVDKTEWNRASNGLNFIMAESNELGADRGNIRFHTQNYDANNGTTHSPKLIIEYSPVGTSAATVNTQSSSESSYVGLRFNSLQVPSDVELNNGYLEVTANTTVDGGGDLKVKIISPSESTNFIDVEGDVTGRSVVAISNFVMSEWIEGEKYQLNIKDMLTTHFNRSDWCGGSDLVFVLESETLSSIRSSEFSQDDAPRLFVDFSSASGNACGLTQSSKQVNAPNNDGYVTSSGVNYISQSTLILGGTYDVGVRFTDINLKQGDEVIEAYIEFTGSQVNTQRLNFNVFGDVTNNNNPIPYANTDGEKISSRFATGLIGGEASYVEPFVIGDKVKTTDISNTINSIISRADWDSENSMSLILRGAGGSFSYVYSNDFDLSDAPRLFYKVKKQGAFGGVTVRQKLIELLKQLQPNSGTPTLSSTIEVYDYFTNGNVTGGLTRRGNRTKRVSSEKSFIDGTIITPANCDNEENPNASACAGEIIIGTPTYISPVSDAICETNNIIHITDGAPTNEGAGMYASARAITGTSCNNTWDCIWDVTQYLAERDHFLDKEGVQNIVTNVVGFNFTDPNTINRMEEYARRGQGNFYNVADSNSLATALALITEAILEVETTIATPGVSVNQNNKFQFLNELYYSVFKPDRLNAWSGNLKKYKIESKDSTGDVFDIVDITGVSAIDLESGFFKEGSQSFWSSEPDGASVIDGGAASHLVNERNLFTFTEDPQTLNNVSLNQDKYRLNSSNDELTKEDFSVQEVWNDADFEQFIEWTEGKDVRDEDRDGSTNDSRGTMGSLLHSQPIVVNYDENNSTIFVGSNEGYLHAIDTTTGRELFGFIPKELLPNLYQKYRQTVGPLIYGMDNTWIARRQDYDKDGTIGNHANDKVTIYGGMRRGGSSIYSLDVTNVKNSNVKSNIYPKVNWIIDPTTSTEFQNLGQSWSVPVLARVKWNGSDRIVMLFGGGYDTSHDNPESINTIDVLGRQIYMVDADTGALLWWASGSGTGATEEIAGMNHSITGKLNLIDLDNDGYLDYFYVGDLGGQVLKFKVNGDNTGASNFADGKIFAQLGVTDPKKTRVLLNNRKIYERVATVPIIDGDDKFMAIVVGTGYRAKPLTTNTEDGFFVLKDKEIINGEFNTSTTLKIDDLGDLTFKLEDEQVDSELDGKDGYVIWLKEGAEETSLFMGEKVMGEIVVFKGSAIFTTYFPQSEPRGCSPVSGTSRSYSINLLTGQPNGDFNSEDEALIDETANQKRYVEQLLPGIASGTKILYTDSGVVAITNTDARGLGTQSGLGLYRSSWYPKNEKEAVREEQLIPPHLRGGG